MTQYSGCQQCGANTYSGAGAETCTPCPDNKISAAGSTSEAHCKYGKDLTFLQKMLIHPS